MIISTTTIIAGAVVVLLAVLGSLINPFLRSLRFQKTETAENQPPVSRAAGPVPVTGAPAPPP